MLKSVNTPMSSELLFILQRPAQRWPPQAELITATAVHIPVHFNCIIIICTLVSLLQCWASQNLCFPFVPRFGILIKVCTCALQMDRLSNNWSSGALTFFSHQKHIPNNFFSSLSFLLVVYFFLIHLKSFWKILIYFHSFFKVMTSH